MLAFMTYSVWIGIAVTIGATIGFYLFGANSDKKHEHRAKCRKTTLPEISVLISQESSAFQPKKFNIKEK